MLVINKTNLKLELLYLRSSINRGAQHMSSEFFTHNVGMSSMSCMPRMSWMSWPRLQPRRRLFVAATSAPSEPWSFVLFLLLFRCVCVLFPLRWLSSYLCVWVGGWRRRTKKDERRKGRMQPDKRNTTFPCPGPKNSSQLLGAPWCFNIVATCFWYSLILHCKEC